MNKLRKVGVSALAGSLAMVSAANAVEFAVTGDALIKYVTAEGNESGAAASNGKGIGVDNDLYFNASGELDNGWTVSVFAALNLEATTTSNESSVQTSIGMGSLGTIQFNDIFGPSSWIDDMSASIHAYEEPWDSTSHGRMIDSFGLDTQSGSISYLTPAFDMGGVTLSATATYDPNAGAGPAAPGSTGTNSLGGTAYTVKAVFGGIEIGGGVEDQETALTTPTSEESNVTGYIVYKNGPLGIMYQEVQTNAAANSVTTGSDYDGEIWGISFAQGDWAMSYVEQTENKDSPGAISNGKEVEMNAITASYTMGAMSIKGGIFETTNPEWTTGKYEETEIALSFAF